MKKRLITMMLALAAIATTARAQKEKYDLYVGGVQVNSNNAGNITGGGINSGTAVYNSQTRVLTLTNINITRSQSGSEGITSGMNPLTIKFVGNCRVVTGKAASLRLNKTTTVDIAAGATVDLMSDDNYCVYLDGGASTHVTFTGTGTLNLKQTLSSTSSKNNYTRGMTGKNQNEKVTFNGPTVNFKTHIVCLSYLGEVNFMAGKVNICAVSYGEVQAYKLKAVNFYNGQHVSSPLGARYEPNRPGFGFKQGTPYYGEKGYTREYEVIINSNFKARANSTDIPDVLFLNYIKANFDLNEDGYISTSEVEDAKVKKDIDVSNKNISFLKGIEFFTNITSLKCSGNSLSSLDVSKNTKLQTLYCNNNKLTSIDVSKNIALTDLRVANNKLTSLNVSNNKKLLNLFCNGNQINKTAMQTLVNSLPSATNSYLVAIDTKNSSEGNVITKSQVTEAKNKKWNVQDYNGGNLVAYAGSDPGIAINSTNFPDANFRSFVSGTTIDKDKDGYLSTTEIAAVTSMDVSEKSIKNLKGIEHFTALTTLRCGGNGLTSLDISKNTKLTFLNCYNNSLTSLNVSANTALTTLYCQANKLKSLDVSKNTALANLDCGSNQLTSLSVTSNTKLKLLRFEGNQITTVNLSKNTALTTLWCHTNQMNGTNMQSFVTNLPKVSAGEMYLVKGSTDKNTMTKAQVTTVKGKGWKVYSWNGSNWVAYAGSDPGIAIDQSYFPDKEWRSLVTTNYDKDKDGYLSDAEIKAVTSISVTDKTIANFKGIDIFTELTSLVINRCKTTSLDVSKNTKLTNLNVTTNSLSSLNVSKNTLLKTLYCGANQLSALNVSANTALTTLYCHKNKLTALDVSKNTKLTTLYVYINQIKTSSAMQTLVNGLPKVTGGQLWIIDTKDKSEGNVITKAQVTAAKNKGWSVYNYNGGSGVNYAGSDDPTPVEAIEADADPQNARWYTIDGKKLSGEPTKKGVYIRNGKKVVK